ncbi:hypothetical protein AYX14_06922 [Cryptococcus neoformans]|nr:hypothetical protein AYX14_06922 [Cryptococcus neoformans var. grubii]
MKPIPRRWMGRTTTFPWTLMIQCSLASLMRICSILNFRKIILGKMKSSAYLVRLSWKNCYSLYSNLRVQRRCTIWRTR